MFSHFRWYLQKFDSVAITFLIMFGASAIIYAPFFLQHFSSDSYPLMFYQEVLMLQASQSGRPLTAIAVYLLSWAGFNLVQQTFIVVLASIAIFAAAFALLADLWRRFVAPRSGSVWPFLMVAILVTFNNIFTVEFYYFSFHLPFYALSLLLTVLAIKRISPLSGSVVSYRDWLIACLYLTAAMFFYQSWPAAFWPLVALGTLALQSGRPLACVNLKYLSMAGGIYVIAGLVDYLYIKSIHPWLFPYAVDLRLSRPDILANLADLWRAQGNIWINSLGVMPPYVFLALLFLILAAMCWMYRSYQDRWSKLLFLIILVFAASLFCLLPQLALSHIFFPPRSLVIMAALPGLLLLSLLPDFNGWPVKFRRVAAVLVAIVLTVNIVSIWRMGIANLEVNRRDQVLANDWARVVESYERRSGERVRRAYFHRDAHSDYCYDLLPCTADMNVRSVGQIWSAGSMLAIALGRGLDVQKEKSSLDDLPAGPAKYLGLHISGLSPAPEEQIDPEAMAEEDYLRFFGPGADWSEFSVEQVQFAKDNVYIAVY